MTAIIDRIYQLTIECIKGCYIQTCIVALTAGLISLFAVKGRNPLKIFGDFVWSSLMAGYLTLLAYGTFLERTLGFRREVCLIPFHIFLNWDYEKVFIIGNFLLFMPFGILFAVKSGKVWRVMCASIVLSTAIEVSQYIFSVGKSEVDDIILNTAGAVLVAIPVVLIRRIAAKTRGSNPPRATARESIF